jgi:hypothetical protein
VCASTLSITARTLETEIEQEWLHYRNLKCNEGTRKRKEYFEVDVLESNELDGKESRKTDDDIDFPREMNIELDDNDEKVLLSQLKTFARKDRGETHE